MNFDLRIPIGLMFSLYGVILVIYGLMTAKSDMYERSLGLNMNLWWGLAMLLFGVVMLVASRCGAKAKVQK